jgi:hypothetical protein
MRKSVSHVVIVSVSLFLPIILHAQELTADVVIHRTNGEDAKGKLYRGKMPSVWNLPRRDTEPSREQSSFTTWRCPSQKPATAHATRCSSQYS